MRASTGTKSAAEATRPAAIAIDAAPAAARRGGVTVSIGETTPSTRSHTPTIRPPSMPGSAPMTTCQASAAAAPVSAAQTRQRHPRTDPATAAKTGASPRAARIGAAAGTSARRARVRRGRSATRRGHRAPSRGRGQPCRALPSRRPQAASAAGHEPRETPRPRRPPRARFPCLQVGDLVQHRHREPGGANRGGPRRVRACRAGSSDGRRPGSTGSAHAGFVRARPARGGIADRGRALVDRSAEGGREVAAVLDQRWHVGSGRSPEGLAGARPRVRIAPGKRFVEHQHAE